MFAVPLHAVRAVELCYILPAPVDISGAGHFVGLFSVDVCHSFGVDDLVADVAAGLVGHVDNFSISAFAGGGGASAPGFCL